MYEKITPLVLTYNEAPNLRRALEQLSWAAEIVVLDSFSADDTENICREIPAVRFVQRRFDDHTSQWNFGLELVRTEWVLSLDADYILSDELVRELRTFKAPDGINACFARFTYCVNSHRLRGALYPPRAVLFRKTQCRYVADGHTQLLRVVGRAAWLNGRIYHDDRKPLERWFTNQLRYAGIEARYLIEAPASQLSRMDRIRRKLVLAPALVFLHALVGKALILDGWPGWFYVFQRTVVELLISLELLNARFRACSIANKKGRASSK